jgi:transglutaminase-like putative cysteine protease
MRRYILFLLVSLFALAAYSNLPVRTNFDADQATPSRAFAFTYQAHVPAIQDANGKFLLWLPLPQQDEYQSVRDLQIESAVAHSLGREVEYGNSYVLFQPTSAQVGAGFDATIHFVATRFEHRVSLDSATAKIISANASVPKDLQRDLEPDNLIPLNGVIADLAEEHTAGDATALAKAHHIYDYVLATMRYDKSGEGWGRGDAVWACSAKRGNCTDFHSLLIGMMRASGIPARFEIGFPLPESKTEGDIPGYHCWAEFYLYGTGWIPVDASEAWKNPAKRDYFFGAHDVNRVFFTYGRDLHLSPQQQGDPLNYFIYPYAEFNGKAVSGIQTKFSFRDVSPATTSAASAEPR